MTSALSAMTLTVLVHIILMVGFIVFLLFGYTKTIVAKNSIELEIAIENFLLAYAVVGMFMYMVTMFAIAIIYA